MKKETKESVICLLSGMLFGLLLMWAMFSPVIQVVVN